MHRKLWITSLLAVVAVGFISCQQTPDTTIQSGDLTFTVNDRLHTSVASANTPQAVTPLQPTEYLLLDGEKLTDFELKESESEALSDIAVAGTQYTLTGLNPEKKVSKKLTIKVLDEFPNMITIQIQYTNQSDKDLLVTGWVNHGYQIPSMQDDPPFWAFQGSSSGARADWIKPVSQGYYQQNYMGMNDSDYGGGIPVTDIWRRDVGIMIGHLTPNPELISLPTEMKKYSDYVEIGVTESFDYPNYLKPGESINTLETMVGVHEGDYYNGLELYSKLMQARGIKMPASEPAAFESIWCAWGYERNFTVKEVLGTLPKVKELGIKWAVLDDGFQQAEGDWHTNKDKFPGGDLQMKAFVDEIHKYGLKAKLWWAPLAADPTSQLLAENPKMRLYLEDWAPQYITWWDAYYLSPTHPKTKQHTQEIVDLFLKEWDFDGLKMDGQHMNAVAPDHNPGNGLQNPEDAVRLLPGFYQLIYDRALEIKPNAVVENCPCGTCMSYFNMPYMNQAVSSDPTSSWQIRLKGKTYKALIPKTAYYGDHVELSDNGDDFASSFGIGAVLGTKFTWPKDNPTQSQSFLLTPEKEKVWKKWFNLYEQKMLSTEQYRGDLYDLGYDKPETHAIQKGDTLHYAFYADSWTGNIELRGLEDKDYIIRDYVSTKTLGETKGSLGQINCTFEDYLLIEVYPK